MPEKRLNYDPLAPSYDRRYTVGSGLDGVGQALEGLILENRAERALEVGCGTGHWLRLLGPHLRQIAGLDLSGGMLTQARARAGPAGLVRGQAVELPFAAGTFDLVYCVNALHHFPDFRRYLLEATRLLRPGGRVAVVGMDPDAGLDRWYLYDYFEGLRESDRRRFPTGMQIHIGMLDAGLTRGEWRPVDRIRSRIAGRQVLENYFLQRESSSQLALLSPEAYAAGLERIRAAVDEAERAGQEAVFQTDITLWLLVGWTPE